MWDSVQPSRRLVAALFGTLKLTRMYGSNHGATGDALHTLTQAVRNAVLEDELRVSVRGTRLQVNGRAMRAAECGALALSYLAEEWLKRGIEHVRFSADTEPRDLDAFCRSFIDVDLARPDPAGRLIGALAAAGCLHITVERGSNEQHEPVIMEERRGSAMRTYLRGLRAFREVLRCDGVRDRRKLRQARRAIRSVVDSFLEDESAVLALAQIHGHDVKLFHHSLNVCLYALLIGERLGMTRRQLGDLGLASLFHDLGRTAGAADETAEQGRVRHTARGARMLLEDGTAHEGVLRAAVAAYEHHAHLDGGGFPALEHTPHLVSRIVAIADRFETLVAPRGDAPPRCPREALALMQSRAGAEFDPALLKLFGGALGIYPVGSVVELDSGEIAIVAQGPTDPDRLDQPIVRILDSARGELPADTLVDLAEGGQRIRRALPSEKVFATVGDHVAAL